MSKGKNMRIREIASDAEYRMNKEFQKLPIIGILIIFKIEKILKIY